MNETHEYFVSYVRIDNKGRSYFVGIHVFTPAPIHSAHCLEALLNLCKEDAANKFGENYGNVGLLAFSFLNTQINKEVEKDHAFIIHKH